MKNEKRVHHKIRKPLFFLMLALVLVIAMGSIILVSQNKPYIFKKISSSSSGDFDVDQLLLKVLVKSHESLDSQLRVMNTGDTADSISIKVEGLQDIVFADEPSFTLKPGQTKVVGLKFLSFNDAEKLEQQPGIYVGKLVVKSEKFQKEVPVIVEIETKDVLFDMNLNPLAIDRKVKRGSSTTIEVRLYNLESVESSNVMVDYFVKDMEGNTIITESETVVAKTQTSFFKTISIPNDMNPGTYVFGARAKFGTSVGTASYVFEVTGPENENQGFVQFCGQSALCMGLSLTTVLLLFVLVAYLYFFVGAYVYEKTMRMASEKKHKYGVVSAGLDALAFAIKRKKQEWREKILIKKAERERLNMELESQRAADEKLKRLEQARSELEERKKERLLKNLEEVARKKEQQEKIRAEQEAKRQREIEEKEKEEYRKLKQLEKEKRAKERKENFIGFLHLIGVYRTAEEKRQFDLLKQKERDESIREVKEERKKIEEARRKKELEKQARIEAEKKELEKKAKEEQKRIREAEKLRIEEEERKKLEELRKQKESEEKARAEEERKKLDAKNKEIIEKHKAIEKKEIGLEKKAKEEQKKKSDKKEIETLKSEEPKTKPKAKYEFGFLRSLFKKHQTLHEEQPEKIVLMSKNKKFAECCNLVNETKNALVSNGLLLARKKYAKARQIYVNLGYEEKKELYNDLKILYDKVKYR